MTRARRKLRSMAHGLLATLILLPATVAWSEGASWQLQQQDDNIYIYYRKVDGSSYKAIKATVLIDLMSPQSWS